MSQSKELGTLVVVVLKARHLHQPSFYKQDPYAQVALSGQTQKTKPDPKGGQHPVWDDEFRFPVLADPGKDQVNRKLEVSCWKDEPRSEPKLLGKGVIDIESTLKTGEFDDWVQLETSGGARGELYLEMTFYANAPPPLNRRATKLKPSDRLARPQSYHPGPLKSGVAHLSADASPPPPPGRSPNPTPVQLYDPGYVAPATPPTFLLPARGQPPSWAQPKTPPSKSPSPSPRRQSPQNKTDTLPPLPEEVEAPRKPGHLPTILRPGGRPTPSAGRYGTPTWNHDSSSDAPVHIAPPTPMSLLQTPVQERPLELSELLGVRTPLIVTDEPMDEHYQSSFPIAAPHTPEPQFRHEQGQGQSNYYLSSNATPQQYPPPSQGYVPPQTFSPPPQSYQQPYTPQNYAPPSPRPQQYSPPSLHAHQYQVHQPPSLIPPYQPPSTPYPHSYSPNLYSPPPPPPPPQSHTTFAPSPSPYPPSQPQGYAQQQPQTYTAAPPQQQAYQQPSYFHPPPPAQTPVLPPTTQPSPTPSPSYFSPPPPPPPLPESQQGTPAARGEPQSPQIQGHQNVAPAALPALGLGTASTSPSQSSPAEAPLASSVPPIVSEDQRKREEDQSIKAVEDEEQRRKDEARKATEEADLRRREEGEARRRAADEERRRQEEEEQKMKEAEEQKRREEERLKCEAERRQKEEEEHQRREDEEERRRVEERRQAEEARLQREEEERWRLEEERRRLEEERRKREEARLRLEEERVKREEEARRKEEEEEQRRREVEEDEARRKRAEEAEAERRWQIELARIKARAEQEASDAAFARAQFEAQEAERRRQEEEDLAFARRAHEEAEREHRAAEERRRQEELDRELARREQAHEEELERKREEERRRRVEETDREMARKLDMELNLGPGDTTSSPELPARRRGG